ncbi:MAG: hypothetical protein ACLFVN_10315 [Phycisphaeraceae bacterium]
MTLLLFILDAAIIFSVLWILVKITRRIVQTRAVLSKDVLIAMFTVAYVVPLIGMNLYGYATWTRYPLTDNSLYRAIQSTDVQLQYRLFVGLTILAVYWLGSSRKLEAGLKSGMLGVWRQQYLNLPLYPVHPMIRQIYTVCWLVLLATPLTVLLSPNPAAYLVYVTPSERFGGSDWALSIHSIISMFCLLAVGAYAFILWVKIRENRRLLHGIIIFAMILAMIACYIHGKRSIVFLFMLTTGAVAYLEGALRPRHIVAGIVALVAFMQVYVALFKGGDGTSSVYGDLFRDYTLLPVIAGADWTSHEAMPRGSGFLFQFLFWVPRAVWPAKPWPTPEYVTPWIIGTEQDLAWGFGLGYLEDGMANFGYVGAVAYIAAVILVCRLLDTQIYLKSRNLMIILWLPLAYGCVFAFSVVIKHLLFIVTPVLVAAMIVSNPRNWGIAGVRDASAGAVPEAGTQV